MKIRAALAAAFLLAAPALAQEPPRRIVTSIMHEPGDAADALSGLRDGEIVYLDILFLDPGDTCVGDWGPLTPAPGARLGLPQDGDNHLLVQVAPGAPEASPSPANTHRPWRA